MNKTNLVTKTLNFTYYFTSPGHLNVKFTDLYNKRWEMPNEFPYPHTDSNSKFAPYDDALVKVVVKKIPFSFQVIRTKTNEVIFDSSGQFIFSDYYLQLSTSLPTSNIYGLGERGYKFNLGPDGTYSLYNRDNEGAFDTGTSGNMLYSYHPVYLMREKSHSFHMAYLRTSSPMDVTLEAGKKLTYRIVGGVLDFHFFVGTSKDQTPETVTKQYHEYIGKWTIQPFWSFGFHECKWGYQSVYDLNDVLANYSQYELPLDALWTDIDAMDHNVDFTLDEENFPRKKMKELYNKYNKKWVPLWTLVLVLVALLQKT